MSALPPEADVLIVGINVCYVPEADCESRSESNRSQLGCTETLSTLPVNANVS
jgi:hypothetical protein